MVVSRKARGARGYGRPKGGRVGGRGRGGQAGDLCSLLPAKVQRGACLGRCPGRTSIQAVARLSGGTTCRRIVISLASSALQPRAVARVACHRPRQSGPYPQREIRFHVRRPVTASRRHAAGMPVQDGAAVEIVQAEDREPDPVQFGKRDGRGGAAVAAQGVLRLAAAVVREHAEPRSGQLPGGPGGDAVAADVKARAQRGELAGDRAERRQGAARLQCRDGVAEAVGDAGEPIGSWHGRMQPELVREGQGQQEQPYAIWCSRCSPGLVPASRTVTRRRRAARSPGSGRCARPDRRGRWSGPASGCPAAGRDR